MTLPDDFLPRATRLLLPRLSMPDEREAWLAQAFFLNDPRLYHDLRQLSGAPIVYVTRCITALLTAKCIPGRDVHSLALLLNAVRIGSAPAEQQEIDTLVTLLDPMCGPDSTDAPAEKPVITDTRTQPAVKPAVPLQTIDTPVDQRTPTVFISYAHVDDDFAHQLIADLQNAGHAIWIDTVSIKGGDAWVRSIADGIRNSYAFLSIISPEANTSRWVLREYLLAENLKKPIYPVLARQADIPFQMIDRQVVLMHEDYAGGLRELLETLPAPSIPVPAIEDVIFPQPVAPPAASAPPMQPTPAPQRAGPTEPAGPPMAEPASKGGGIGLPDIGGMVGDLLGGIRDLMTGRSREKEAAEPSPADGDASKRRQEQPEAPAPPVPPKPVTPSEDFDQFGEGHVLPGAEEAPAAPAVSRRALELQYVQRQWAEAFSAQQDAPETDDDMIVRWMALPVDGDLDDATGDVESGHIDNVGAGLMSMRRAIVMGDSPREVSESVWSALDALMQGALNDPSKPLPVIINLARWTDPAQTLDSFVHGQLGELGDYWHSLLEQKRAALLFTGFEDLPADQAEARKDAVEDFLRRHPELLVLVAMVG